MKLSRTVGTIVRVNKCMSVFSALPGGEIVEVNEQMGGYRVRGLDGREFWVGPLELDKDLKVEMADTKTQPTTLEEAVIALRAALNDEDRACVLGQGRDFTSIQVRIQVTRWMRNNFGLWEQGPLYHHMKGLGYEHPDDMSARIYEEFIRFGGNPMPPDRFNRDFEV